jgi:predicted kinase
MPTLTITRGLPGSGKTYWARQRVISGRGQVARVNRDDIRSSMFAAPGKTVLDHASEQIVTRAQQDAARALLAAGRDVIVDDTNLRLKFARQWADLAVAEGAGFAVEDFTDVPLATCIERDAMRAGEGVGWIVITGMYERLLSGGRTLPPVTPTDAAAAAVRPYTRPAPGTLPPTWLVDIDGTLALMNGRGPFDWHRVAEDRPNEAVVALVRALSKAGYWIVLMSGRDEVCREATQVWLTQHDVPHEALHMRPAGDMRKDSIVKAELFDAHVRDWYDVVGVVDDREQVVRMWRAMGLTVAQVDEGRF